MTTTATTAAAATTTTTAIPNPPLSHDTLRERILTGGGGSVIARGSLAKVASRYADFLRSLRRVDDGDDDGGCAAAASIIPAPPASAAEVAARAFETELRLHDLEVRKSALSYRARDADSSRCASALRSLGEGLSSMRREVEDLKGQLAREKAARRRREEYDALARMGGASSSSSGGGDDHRSGTAPGSLPPVRTTRMELEDVRREMAKVEGEVARARWELTVRERQLRVVMAALGDLGATLREEETRKMETMAEDGDVSDGTGLDASTTTTTTPTKSIQKGYKRKRSNEGRGDDHDDDGDDLHDNCGAI